MEHKQPDRQMLVDYARTFGIEIAAGEEEVVAESVLEYLGFLADIMTLDPGIVPPAAVYDPAWSQIGEVAK